MEGYKQIFGYWIKEGGERLSFWHEISPLAKTCLFNWSNLNDMWMRRPIYAIKNYVYRVRRMMELIYFITRHWKKR